MMHRIKWSVVLLAGMLGCGGEAIESVQDSAQDVPIQVYRALNSSGRPGMGATTYFGGTTFRVWAPGAQAVWVKGEFSNWAGIQLGNEFNGNFSGDVAGASHGQRYYYTIQNRWGGYQDRKDPRSAWQVNSTGDSRILDHGTYNWLSSVGATRFDEMVIYEMHIGTFNDSPGFGPGNFKSAIDKLNHVRDMGFNMVQVMPVMEFPGDFSWGYNPSYPMAPESAYGEPNFMKEFVDQAHARGLGVIFDVVHNHYGPNDLPHTCFNGDCMGAQGQYFYTDYKNATPWGNTRPDYGRPEVRAYIRDSMMSLLDAYRGDGLRWDATKYMRTVDGNEGNAIGDAWQVFRSINREINSRAGWKISIAEDFGAGDAITNGSSSDTSGGADFDAQWAGEFVHPVRNAVITMNDADRNMFAVRDAITQRFSGRHTARIIYTESHDEVANGRARVPEEIWPGNAGSWESKKRSTLAAGILFTSPGIPLMFQGQEMLEDGYFQDTDPLDWNKASYFPGIVTLYRDLIRLRRNTFDARTRGLRGGNVNVHHVNNTSKVIAYHRWESGGAGDDVVVVANFSRNTFNTYNIGFPKPGKWYLRFNSDSRVYSPDFGNTPSMTTEAFGGGKDGMSYNASFAIGPYSVLIFSQ